jgi:hypothetical protein
MIAAIIISIPLWIIALSLRDLYKQIKNQDGTTE